MAGCDVEEQSTARVERVIDGDTAVLSGVGTTRLIGADALEEGRCGGDAATRFTRRRLENRRVKYERGKDSKDRWRRTLAYLTRDGTMHNLALIEEGYAKALPIRHKYANRFKAAEQEAKQQDKGPLADCAQKREEKRREDARARAKERAEREQKRQEDARRRARAKARAERAEQAERLARRLRALERRAKEELRNGLGRADGLGRGDGSGGGGSSDAGAGDAGAPKRLLRRLRFEPERTRRSHEPRRIKRRVRR